MTTRRFRVRDERGLISSNFLDLPVERQTTVADLKRHLINRFPMLADEKIIFVFEREGRDYDRIRDVFKSGRDATIMIVPAKDAGRSRQRRERSFSIHRETGATSPTYAKSPRSPTYAKSPRSPTYAKSPTYATRRSPTYIPTSPRSPTYATRRSATYATRRSPTYIPSSPRSPTYATRRSPTYTRRSPTYATRRSPTYTRRSPTLPTSPTYTRRRSPTYIPTTRRSPRYEQSFDGLATSPKYLTDGWNQGSYADSFTVSRG